MLAVGGYSVTALTPPAALEKGTAQGKGDSRRASYHAFVVTRITPITYQAHIMHGMYICICYVREIFKLKFVKRPT